MIKQIIVIKQIITTKQIITCERCFKILDIFVIGGGVNGVAIARDAAGRNLSVALAEKEDLASETSSKSTKLFHGGLRYLEYFEFKLVRDALIEREILLKNMPHIAWPMRFILPFHASQRFEGGTPTSELLGTFMPWLKGSRPSWLLRLGLFLYDTIGGRKLLAATTTLDLRDTPEGEVLRDKFEKAFEYSDVWAQDSRLVSLMARDAQARGAEIITRNKVLCVTRHDDYWDIETAKGKFQAKNLVNASGPWVEDITRELLGIKPRANVRLVKGSHIVINQLYEHEKAYFFQGRDGRIIFALPYEQSYTLIGTTDEPHEGADNVPECSEEEIKYLTDFASEYFEKPVLPGDVVWSFAGVRPLYDDGAKSATASTREYVLKRHDDHAVLLNVFGGKITTHRKLAEDALALLGYDGTWTHDAPLAGGDFDIVERNRLIAELAAKFPDLNAERLFSAYGHEAQDIFANEWGAHFGSGLYQCEVDHLMTHEFAKTTDDILWRRTKLGLVFDAASVKKLETYMQTKIN